MTEEITDIEAISPNTIFVSGEAVTEDDALAAVELVVHELYDSNNLDDIDKTEDTLLGLQRISGKALAKLLYGKRKWWMDTNQDEQRNDTFEDYENARHNIKSITIDRYINVWDKIQADAIPKKFLGRRMDDLIKVSSALEQGFEISKDTWNKLIKSASSAELRLILSRDVRHSKPRKSSMRLYLERDGSIVAWKENKRYHVGFLDLESEDVVVQKAVTRIITSTGIMKK